MSHLAIEALIYLLKQIPPEKIQDVITHVMNYLIQYLSTI